MTGAGRKDRMCHGEYVDIRAAHINETRVTSGGLVGVGYDRDLGDV